MKIVNGLRKDINVNEVTSIYPNISEGIPVENILFSACIEAHRAVIFNAETDLSGKPFVRDNAGNWHRPDDAREYAKALLIAADIAEGKEPRDYDEPFTEIPARNVLLNACETTLSYFSESSYYHTLLKEAIEAAKA